MNSIEVSILVFEKCQAVFAPVEQGAPPVQPVVEDELAEDLGPIDFLHLFVLGAHFGVDLVGDRCAEARVAADLFADEDFVAAVAEALRAELLAHAVLGHHRPGDLADPVDVVPTEMLSFIALYGGELTTGSSGKIVAFWWDPTGETLAWLEPSDQGNGMLQWWFSDRNQVWGGVSFTPSQTFASNYLPFFDQYAQSHSFFSPDGTELTFAGQLANGEQGVFVVGVERGAQANKIADGVFAVWSPDAAGGGTSVL